ncbi:MAG TPA: CPBP family intramembrane metalloprotease [Candidatus Merdibacter merdavium]|uniref:CPBP family intramembrane metalloprotease n=1 Tax=Candidatus Merdibacter merdavium TaxID=2838692 RepID=A0A9D2SUL6_9FIRM|nr:CPBP family intramembrane metalloprotease [Candidatus Merdibacter merdavium]
MADKPKKIFKNISVSILLYQLISLIVSFAVLSMALPFMLRTGNDGSITTFSNIAMLLSVLISWLLIRSCFQPKTEGEIHWRIMKPMSAGTMFRFFILAYGGMMVGSLIVALFSALVPGGFDTPDFSPSSDLLGNILLVITTVIAAPLFEEYLFRGVCMMGLKRYGNGFAILVTSFLFAFMHGNIPQAVPIFFFSLVLCYVDIRTDSLLPGLIFHIANNAISQMMLFIQNEAILALFGLFVLVIIIAAVVIFILELQKKEQIQAELKSPYDFRFSAFFNNWASITLLVLLIVMMAINILAPLT